MPVLDLPDHRIHYRVDGDASAPWLILCNSLGTDLHMWEPQVEALAGRFHILRYDRRGHGQSTGPAGKWTLAGLGGDVIALMDHLGIARAHFCGLSIGGLTGQWLGIHAPSRLDRLVVCATAPRIGTAESWAARAEAVRRYGLSSIREATVGRWFSPDFAEREPGIVGGIMKRFVGTPTEGYCACCEALGAADLRADVGAIPVPVLAISGKDDAVSPPSDLESIAKAVGNGRHVSLPGRHIC